MDPESPTALLPIRQINEFVYCPRLFYLEWVHAEWAENYFTADGADRHRNVDKESREVPAPGELGDGRRDVRSVWLRSDTLGITGKMDVVRMDGDAGTAEPIDYKRGRRPDIAEGAWPPERAQVCAQALLLRENGYRCDRGWIYFTESNQRVAVELTDELVRATLEAIKAAREAARGALPPPPLEDSPKCDGCSLQPICLPDEVNLLRHATAGSAPRPIRRLLAAAPDAQPFYLTESGFRVGLRGGRLVVKDRERKKVAEARLHDVSQVCVFGRVEVSTCCVRRLCERHISLCYFSSGGWFFGRTEGVGHRNIDLRVAQFRAAAVPEMALSIARRIVSTKIRNCRTLLRRNARGEVDRTLRELQRLARTAERTEKLPSLLGVEGLAARAYFGVFDAMLRAPASGDGSLRFELDGRSRRPPRDPVNAMLSFAYAMLVKDCTVTLAAVGLDPYLGYLHQSRYGRPALALDIMEEMRPLVADSAVITAINNGMVSRSDFVERAGACALTPAGRRGLLRAYEQRMTTEVTHPIFGYRLTYRRLLEVQARLLGRYLLGEIEEPPTFRTR